MTVPMMGFTTGPRPPRPVLRAVPPPRPIPPPRDFLRRVVELREAEQDAGLKVDLSLPVTDAKKPTFAALKAETPEGCCIGCDRPLPPRKQMLCGAAECLQVYRDVWYGDRNAALRRSR